MFLSALLPPEVRLLRAEPGDGEKRMVLWLTTCSRAAACPLCQHRTRRVHSHYQRTLADLPCADYCLILHVQVRRFFCTNKRCARHIFAERLPQLTMPHAQRTNRLTQIQTHLEQAVGSRPGARLAGRLGMPVSATTLLRLERAAPLPQPPTPRVLGVDDWAFKRGHRYGTILYDLERHQVVDLLPDRATETLCAWLKDHPGVEIVSRDRAEAYAEGARQGAPNAQQVTDRWHLVKNLGKALERLLDEKRRLLRQAVQPVPEPQTNPAQTAAATGTLPSSRPPRRAERTLERLKQCRRQDRLERYQQVRALYQNGWNISQIARFLNLATKTVRTFAYSDAFPERKERAPRPCLLDAYKPYLNQRWQEGCHNAAKLFHEVREQGYRGGYSRLRDYLLDCRHVPTANEIPAREKVSGRQVAMWTLRRLCERTSSQQAILERLQMLCEPFHVAFDLSQQFLEMVRQSPRGDQAETLHMWLTAAHSSSVTALSRFATSLQQDIEAVVAGLSLNWSNGPVEGSNNRLKFLKRRGYGRANFDLLRRRVLQPT